MIRKNLISWQYREYGKNHQAPLNLALHFVSVPIYWLGLITLIYGLISLQLRFAGMGAGCMFFTLVVQGIGHKKEAAAPEPFLSPGDFVSRFFVEQTITYPRWIFRKLFPKA